MISILKPFLQRLSEFPIPGFIWNWTLQQRIFFHSQQSRKQSKCYFLTGLVYFTWNWVNVDWIPVSSLPARGRGWGHHGRQPQLHFLLCAPFSDFLNWTLPASCDTTDSSFYLKYVWFIYSLGGHLYAAQQKLRILTQPKFSSSSWTVCLNLLRANPN